VIRDAFKEARRRLQDYTRRASPKAKRHETMPAGRVIKLVPDEGYGFLEATDGHQVYFHRNSVLNRAFNRLKLGSQVAFVEELGEKGAQASTVKPLRTNHATVVNA
jgi:cold shock CspA family protein